MYSVLIHNNLDVVFELKNPATETAGFLFSFHFLRSEQFQLLDWLNQTLLFGATEQYHFAKLFVGHSQNPDLTLRRQGSLHSFYVNVSVFAACAMPQVDRKLKHGKAIGH